MTENEAIKILKYYDEQPEFLSKDASADFAFKMAIQALEEIQQYRAIGTVEESEKAMDFELAKQDKMLAEVIDDYLKYIKIGTIEEFKALKEKSVAKKVIRLSDNGYYDYKCPACGMPDKDCMGKRYCNCGQALET